MCAKRSSARRCDLPMRRQCCCALCALSEVRCERQTARLSRALLNKGNVVKEKSDPRETASELVHKTHMILMRPHRSRFQCFLSEVVAVVLVMSVMCICKHQQASASRCLNPHIFRRFHLHSSPLHPIPIPIPSLPCPSPSILEGSITQAVMEPSILEGSIMECVMVVEYRGFHHPACPHGWSVVCLCLCVSVSLCPCVCVRLRLSNTFLSLSLSLLFLSWLLSLLSPDQDEDAREAFGIVPWRADNAPRVALLSGARQFGFLLVGAPH